MRHVLLAAIVAAMAVPSAAYASAHQTYTVHIKNFAYDPATVRIAPGDTVRFVNDDQEAHTVTASDRSFDSGGLDTGDGWTATFKKPGRFTYFCALHPWMKATIIVTAPEGGHS